MGKLFLQLINQYWYVALGLIITGIIVLWDRLRLKKAASSRRHQKHSSAQTNTFSDGSAINSEELARQKYIESALRFYEHYIQGLGFELETRDRLLAALEACGKPIKNSNIRGNIKTDLGDGQGLQLDLVLLTANRVFVLECKKWNKGSAQKAFFDTAVARLWLHSNALYRYLRASCDCAINITRIIVVSEDTENVQRIVGGFADSIGESFGHANKYFKVATLKDLPACIVGQVDNIQSEPDPALKAAVSKISSYELIPTKPH